MKTIYLVYGTDCENLSDPIYNEKDLMREMQEVARDDSWNEGDILGCKLVPIYKIAMKNIPVIKIPVEKVK